MKLLSADMARNDVSSKAHDSANIGGTIIPKQYVLLDIIGLLSTNFRFPGIDSVVIRKPSAYFSLQRAITFEELD